MGKNQDPGSGINIPDPQHCEKLNSSPCNLIEARNVFCCLKGRGDVEKSKNSVEMTDM